jgi:hypothetical protein
MSLWFEMQQKNRPGGMVSTCFGGKPGGKKRKNNLAAIPSFFS